MPEIVLIAVGLAMDAFAVSITLGLAAKRLKFAEYLIPGAYFGFFQALMPAIGYFVGLYFADRVRSLDHWIAFALLGFIGGKMIKDSLSKDGGASAEGAGESGGEGIGAGEGASENVGQATAANGGSASGDGVGEGERAGGGGGERAGAHPFGFAKMLLLALATSIDALAVGITFAFLGANIGLAALLTGAITFAISTCGVAIGRIFGARFKSKAEFIGGLTLVIIGAKILVEHMLG
ncbi:MAG: manganese efflux pump MntP family protein [Clostridiales bacterium]|nr:manganese efflux pump MntP family protein [Clostridiales bacterium]